MAFSCHRLCMNMICTSGSFQMNKWLATGIVAVALMVAEFPVSNMKAQDTATPEQNQTVGSLMQDHRYYGAGLQGSFLSGTGISGRVSFPSRLVLATSITVLSTGENATFFTIGSNAQYSFSRRDAGRFFRTNRCRVLLWHVRAQRWQLLR